MSPSTPFGDCPRFGLWLLTQHDGSRCQRSGRLLQNWGERQACHHKGGYRLPVFSCTLSVCHDSRLYANMPWFTGRGNLKQSRRFQGAGGYVTLVL